MLKQDRFLKLMLCLSFIMFTSVHAHDTGDGHDSSFDTDATFTCEVDYADWPSSLFEYHSEAEADAPSAASGEGEVSAWVNGADFHYWWQQYTGGCDMRASSLLYVEVYWWDIFHNPPDHQENATVWGFIDGIYHTDEMLLIQATQFGEVSALVPRQLPVRTTMGSV